MNARDNSKKVQSSEDLMGALALSHNQYGKSLLHKIPISPRGANFLVVRLYNIISEIFHISDWFQNFSKFSYN